MKFTLNLLLAIYLFVPDAFSQTDSTKIPFVAYWSVGDHYNFSVTKIKKQWKNEELTKNDSTQYVARFDVIDSTEKSYKIKWAYKTNLKGNLQLPGEIAEKLSQYENIDIVYKTDEMGTFIGIENWQEVASIMKKVFEDIIPVVSKSKKIDMEVLKKAMEPLTQAYTSKEGIEGNILKELRYFHFPFGSEFSPKDTILYEDKYPNLFGGDPLRANGALYIEKVDYGEKYCELVQETSINEEDTRKMIINLLGKMYPKKDEMEAAMNKAKIEIADYNRYQFYYNPGVPDRIVAVRSTVIEIEGGTNRLIEKTSIELVD